MMHAFLAVLLLVPAADCTEAEPCVLRVTLDDSGVWFDRPGDHETTVQQHRWYTLDVLSQFDEDHTLTLGDHTFRAGGYDTDGPRSRHGPVPFPDAGTLTLRDATARAQATVHVQEAEPPPEPEPEDPEPTAPTDPEPPEPTESPEPPERRKNVPVPLAVPLAALLIAVLCRR